MPHYDNHKDSQPKPLAQLSPFKTEVESHGALYSPENNLTTTFSVLNN